MDGYYVHLDNSANGSPLLRYIEISTFYICVTKLYKKYL